MTLHAGRPADEAGRPEKELRTYDFLDNLGVPYEQMDRRPQAGEEVQAAARRALDAMICKNILLCNRKETMFYLLLFPWGKRFVTGDVTGRLGVSHLSFAPDRYLEELLGVHSGSVSVLSLMNDREGKVQLVVDKVVWEHHHFACHPCVNTSSVRFTMADFVHKVLPALNHPPVTIDLPDQT